MTDNSKSEPIGQRAHALLGSLKDALAAAAQAEGGHGKARPAAKMDPPPMPVASAGQVVVVPSSSTALAPVSSQNKPRKEGADAEGAAADAALPSAADAAREVRGTMVLRQADRQIEPDQPPTTRVVRAVKEERPSSAPEASQRTQLVRGRPKLARNTFEQDPVVAWLVVVGGPGLGAFRPIFEGNNTIGRAPNQRVPIDFGDDAISSEEQAFIRYDSQDRSFLFVPNLAKTNVVQINDKRPTSAVELSHMDVITMGRTQLVFVPFCGPDFDWAELADVKD